MGLFNICTKDITFKHIIQDISNENYDHRIYIIHRNFVILNILNSFQFFQSIIVKKRF
jgi:hypothetical protein